MKGLQITLTETGYDLLTAYLEHNSLSAFNRKKLLNELENARIVSSDYLPLNIVNYNTKIVVWNMDKNQTFTVHLVLPDETNGKEKISIFDPISLALIGYPSGAVTQWEMPDGINTFKVVSVSPVDKSSVYA